MPIEITILFLAALLLMINILAASHVRTSQYGIEWNRGARDKAMPPLDILPGRLLRAQANLQETLPIAIIVLIGAVAAGRTGEWTAIGGWIWLSARTVYLPLYALGIPKLRTLIFLVSLIGLIISAAAAIIG